MLSEIFVAGTLLVVAAQFSLPQSVFAAIGILGGLVLFYFAWQVLGLRSVSVEEGYVLFSPSKILLLSATNAPLYIFWVTICFPLIWELAQVWPLALAAMTYFAAFEIGWGLTPFIMLLIFVFSRKTLTNERVMGKVFAGVALLLVIFGVQILVKSVQYFL